jgi:nucleotide-binding universal stress UspA family protein
MSNGPIVVGWDGTERSRDAVALAGALARTCNARVMAVDAFSLWPMTDPLPDEATAELQKAAEEGMQPVPPELLEGVEADAHAMPGSSVAHALHDFAEREGAQLVVLGSTHRGPLGRVMPGTTADRFLHGAPCPVAIAPAGYAKAGVDRLEVVAAAFDGTPESRAAAHAAADWALAANGRLHLISVVEPQAYAVFGTGAMTSDDLADDRREYLREQLHRVRDELPPELSVRIRLLTGIPADRVIDEAEKGVDLLVIGSRGYGPVRRVLLGSVSGDVVRHSPCPVMVVPRSVAREAEQPEVETAASA